MVKLSEEMIVARTRVSDMANVKKLNCWGAELTDITVLRKLVNVEVLSLSVNCITSLADIQNCHNLQELYIRKNKISDLGEVCWLRDLPKLKSLWLEENPCVTGQGELYRVTVIRNLPQLQKLDNIAIQSDEMADAMRKGIELVHPMDRDMYPPQPSNDYGYESEMRRNNSQENEPPATSEMSRRPSVDNQTCYPPSRRVSNQSFDLRPDANNPPPVRRSPPRQQTQLPASSSYGSRRNSSYAPIEEHQPYQQQQQQQQQQPTHEFHTERRYSQQEMSSQRAAFPMEEMRRMSMNDFEASYAPGTDANQGYANYAPVAQQNPTYYEYGQRMAMQQQQYESSSCSRSMVGQHYDETYDQVSQQIESAQQHIASRKSSSYSPDRTINKRLPKNRNSNILSAVLCLVKELDGPSLEVVEMAVRCRMEELED